MVRKYRGKRQTGGRTLSSSIILTVRRLRTRALACAKICSRRGVRACAEGRIALHSAVYWQEVHVGKPRRVHARFVGGGRMVLKRG
jgi:hypothetical protein